LTITVFVRITQRVQKLKQDKDYSQGTEVAVMWWLVRPIAYFATATFGCGTLVERWWLVG